MLETSYNIAKDFYPDIEHYVYDFDRRTFVDQRTDESIDRKDFDGISEGLRRESPLRYSGGSATLARAALFNTLLRGEGGSGWPRIVAGLGDQLSGRGLDPALKRLFYSKTSPSFEGLSVSAVSEAIAGPLAKLKNIPDVRVVQDQSEIHEVEAKLKSAAERFMRDGDREALRELESFDRNPVEGAYIDGTLWLVAGSIKTADRATAVLAHEAVGHMSVEQMLDAADSALMPRLIKNVKLLDKAGNRYIRELAAAVDKTQPGLSADQRAKEIIAQIRAFWRITNSSRLNPNSSIIATGRSFYGHSGYYSAAACVIAFNLAMLRVPSCTIAATHCSAWYPVGHLLPHPYGEVAFVLAEQLLSDDDWKNVDVRAFQPDVEGAGHPRPRLP